MIKRRKILIGITVLMAALLLISIFVNANTISVSGEQNPPDNDDTRFLSTPTMDFDSSSSSDILTTLGSSESDGQSLPTQNDDCVDGHGCVSTSLRTPINHSQGLELVIQFENGSWYRSDNLNDLFNHDSDQFRYVVLRNRFGACGFLFSGTFGHGQVVVSPVLQNGTQLKTPLAGIFFKGYVDTGTQIRSTFLTNSSLGYDYADYLQVSESDGMWSLAWEIEDMEIQGQDFDVKIGISISERSSRAKLIQEITPTSRGYDDIGIEYLIIGNPQFAGTELDITKIRAWTDTGIVTKELNTETDFKEIPDFVEYAQLVTDNNVPVHAFDFYDIEEMGLETVYYKIQNIELPDGSNDYVVRTLFRKGSAIAQDEELSIDPGLSVSEASNTISIESTDIYDITLNGGALSVWYDLVNDPSKTNDLINDWGHFGGRYLNNGTGAYWNFQYDSHNYTILENSPTKVVVQVDTFFAKATQAILMYNSIEVRERSLWTFYSDGKIHVKRIVLDEVSSATDESFYFDVRATSWTETFFGNESAMQEETITGTRSYYYTNTLAGLNYSESDWYFACNDSNGFHDYYDDNSAFGSVSHPSGTFVFSVEDAQPLALFAANVGPNPNTTTFMVNLSQNHMDDDASYSKAKQHSGDYMFNASISNEVGGSFDSWNYTYGVYNFSATETYLNYTFSPDSYPRNYSVFQVSNWTEAGVYLYLNDSEQTSGTDYLSYTNTTSEVLVIWLDSSSIGELRGPTNFSLVGYTDSAPPSINLNSPANGSTVKNGDVIDLNIYDDYVVSLVYYNWNGISNQSLDDPYDITISTFSGNKTLNVYAVDGANNWNSSAFQFEVISSIPVITLVSPLNNSIVGSGDIIDFSVDDRFMELDEGTEGHAGEYSTSGSGTMTISDNSSITYWGEYSLFLRYDSTPDVVATRDFPSHYQFLWGEFVGISYRVYIPSVGWENPSYARFYITYDGGFALVSPNLGALSKGQWVSLSFTKGDFGSAPSDSETMLGIGFGFGLSHFNNPGDHYNVDKMDITVDKTGIDTVSYNWNGGDNSTLSDPYDITISGLGDGDQTLNIFANHTSSSWNSKVYQFDVEDPPVISLIGPLNGSSIDILSTIDLDVTDNTGVSKVLYNWDGNSNQTLDSPYNLQMPYDQALHTLRIYSNDTNNNWSSALFQFIGEAGGGGGGEGGGGGGKVEAEKFVVAVEYKVVMKENDFLDIRIRVEDVFGTGVKFADVVIYYNGIGHDVEAVTTLAGIYKITVPRNTFVEGDYEFKITVSKSGFDSFENTYPLRVVGEEKAILPLKGIFAWFGLIPAFLMENTQLIFVAIGTIFLLGVVYIKREALADLVGMELPKDRKPRRPPGLPPLIKGEPFGEMRLVSGRKQLWSVIAAISVVLSIMTLVQLYQAPIIGGSLFFYAISIIFGFLMVLSYDLYDLGEKGEEEAHILWASPNMIIFAFVIGLMATLVSSIIVMQLITAITQYVPMGMWLVPFSIGDTTETFMLQSLVASGENLAIIVLVSLIADAWGLEDKKWQMFASSSVFAMFHFFAATLVAPFLPFQFLFFYFFTGGVMLWLITYGGKDMNWDDLPVIGEALDKVFGNFPRGGFVAGFLVHMGVNLIVILGGLIVIA